MVWSRRVASIRSDIPGRIWGRTSARAASLSRQATSSFSSSSASLTRRRVSIFLPNGSVATPSAVAASSPCRSTVISCASKASRLMPRRDASVASFASMKRSSTRSRSGGVAPRRARVAGVGGQQRAVALGGEQQGGVGAGQAGEVADVRPGGDERGVRSRLADELLGAATAGGVDFRHAPTLTATSGDRGLSRPGGRCVREARAGTIPCWDKKGGHVGPTSGDRHLAAAPGADVRLLPRREESLRRRPRDGRRRFSPARRPRRSRRARTGRSSAGPSGTWRPRPASGSSSTSAPGCPPRTTCTRWRRRWPVGPRGVRRQRPAGARARPGAAHLVAARAVPPTSTPTCGTPRPSSRRRPCATCWTSASRSR